MAESVSTGRRGKVKEVNSLLGVYMHGERGYGETKRSAEIDLAHKMAASFDGCTGPDISCYRDHVIVTWQDRGCWGYKVRALAETGTWGENHGSCMTCETSRAATLAAARNDVDGRFPARAQGGASC